MCLFTVCSVCCGETQGQIEYQEGTYIKIKQVREYFWTLSGVESWPYPGNPEEAWATFNLVCVYTVYIIGISCINFIFHIHRSGLHSMWLSALLAESKYAAPKHARMQSSTQRCHSLFGLHGYTDHQNAEAVWAAVHQWQHFFPPSAPLHNSYHRAGLAEWAERDHHRAEGDWGWTDPLWWLQVVWFGSYC